MKIQTKKMTLVFLIKNDQVCLAEKKRGFRTGYLNGYGGKVENNESIISAAKRELFEEATVINPVLTNMGVVYFRDWDVTNKVYIYTCNKWDKTPVETEEMKPQWYKIRKIPLHKMGKADKVWLPEVLDGKSVKASFYYDKNNFMYKISCTIEGSNEKKI